MIKKLIKHILESLLGSVERGSHSTTLRDAKRTHLGCIPTDNATGNHATGNKRTHLRYVPTGFNLLSLSRVILLSFLVAFATTSCVSDAVPETPVGDKGSKFYLTLTVLSNSGTTRASHTDDFEETGSALENFIDFNNGDFRLVLFDKEGNYIMDLGADEALSLFASSSGNTDGSTICTMEYKLEFPENYTEERIESIRKNGLQALIIANCNSLDNTYSYEDKFGKPNSSSKLSEIWANGTDFNYSISLNDNNSTWLPDAGKKQYIPMFGYESADPFKLKGPEGGFITSATIKMQRAMAKIEVIDNLKNQPDLYVKDVTMTNMLTVGRIIPNVDENENWNTPLRQVDVSSLPTNNLLTPTKNLKFWHDDNNKWIAYVPEMELEKVKNPNPATNVFDPELNADRTHLNVEIAVKEDSQLEYYQGGTYAAHFAKYITTSDTSEPTIPDDSWNHILRNHIYRFSVNKVGLKVQLHLHVVPWVLDDDEEWEFTDHVTVQQHVKWDSDSYQSANNDEIYLKLEDETLNGSFWISTPINGRWYARLTPLDGAKTNAITFCDVEGNVLEPNSGDPAACLEISGLISSGQDVPTGFYIKPTSLGNEEESRFRLEFFVDNLGTWMPVPMTPNGKDYYTIIRSGNQIQ